MVLFHLLYLCKRQLPYILQTDEGMEAAENMSFVDYQTSLVSLAKQIARHAQDMVSLLLHLHNFI